MDEMFCRRWRLRSGRRVSLQVSNLLTKGSGVMFLSVELVMILTQKYLRKGVEAQSAALFGSIFIVSYNDKL